MPSCDVSAFNGPVGYASPVMVVDSGSSVTWTTLDVSHTATNLAGCFSVGFSPTTPGSATFWIESGALHAASDFGASVCDGVTNVNGVFVVDYLCLFHPNMKAFLVIR